jgi:glucose-6-phosphate 1-dehydrogenase
MVPNHLFQLLTMTAMEPPISFSADAVRSKRQDVLGAVHPISADDARRLVVRGQYAAGPAGANSKPAYRQEPRVERNSNTETYVALRLMIDNWRWAGVPFYLRTGKRLARRTTEIAIRFKPAPYLLFRDTPVDRVAADWMVLRIQPDEGIALEFNAKVPGPSVRLERVRMNFLYKDHFRVAPSTGYETLIYDCMIGDSMLFQRADNIEAGWEIVQPILDAWNDDNDTPNFYPAGSEGPAAAAELLERDGRAWRPIEAEDR